MILNDVLSKFFVSNGIGTEKKIKYYAKRADDNSNPIYVEMIKDGYKQEDEIFKALAKFYGIEYRTVQLTELDLDLINKYPREKLIQFRMIPYNEENGQMYFLASNPLRFDEGRELMFGNSYTMQYILVTPSSMENMLSYIDNKVLQSVVLSDFASKTTEGNDVADEATGVDAPIIRLCDSILKEAVSRNASDIHIEPFDDRIVVRFRIDGKLNKMEEIPLNLYQAVLARYKIMAGMNIAERRVPQDGKINQEIDERAYDFRVSTIPTIHGEKIVIRIYNLSYSNSDLAALGFNAIQQELIKNMITRPHGIILLTGPTGSGKSTTLYSFLRYLNNEDTNIITVEDPVENVIEGINQVQVNPKTNLTFATALRSILRQDPNIIMIGEIRDEETAQIATRAAITGHLVLSSIHTNDAAGVVTRLINMGIPKYLVADSLLGSISQRLVRRLCTRCRRKHITTKAQMQFLNLKEPAEIYEPVGCPYCNHTGYFGRAGVFEIMVIDDDIRSIIMDDNFTSEMLNKALEGKMVALLEHTKSRVLNGETSLEEYENLNEIIKTRDHE